MTYDAAKLKRNKIARRLPPLAAILLVLAGCATGGNPASDRDKPLYPGSQSNLSSLSEIIAAHPDDPQAYNMRATVYGEAGHTEQALADFSKAISLDPNYTQAYANRALVYRKVNKLDLALADDNKALTLDASYAPAYLGRGMVYREQGRNNQRWKISTKQSRCGRTTRRPTTIADFCTRASASMPSASTISRWQSDSQAKNRNPMWRAR